MIGENSGLLFNKGAFFAINLRGLVWGSPTDEQVNDEEQVREELQHGADDTADLLVLVHQVHIGWRVDHIPLEPLHLQNDEANVANTDLDEPKGHEDVDLPPEWCERLISRDRFPHFEENNEAHDVQGSHDWQLCKFVHTAYRGPSWVILDVAAGFDGAFVDPEAQTVVRS